MIGRRSKAKPCNCGGAPCSTCEPSAAPAVAQGRQNATTGRFTVERGPDVPGAYGRSFDRNYDVQAFTGYPTSTVPAGQWNRGVLYRSAQPVLSMRSPSPMFDRSDPRTWPHRVG